MKKKGFDDKGEKDVARKQKLKTYNDLIQKYADNTTTTKTSMKTTIKPGKDDISSAKTEVRKKLDFTTTPIKTAKNTDSVSILSEIRL